MNHNPPSWHGIRFDSSPFPHNAALFSLPNALGPITLSAGWFTERVRCNLWIGNDSSLITANRQGAIIMRRRVLAILVVPLVLGPLGLAYGMLRASEQGNKEADERTVIGTWKLSSVKYGGREIELDKLGNTLKHITQTSFVWLSYAPDTGVVSRMGGGT
jgi:hypothetical protein